MEQEEVACLVSEGTASADSTIAICALVGPVGIEPSTTHLHSVKSVAHCGVLKLFEAVQTESTCSGFPQV